MELIIAIKYVSKLVNILILECHIYLMMTAGFLYVMLWLRIIFPSALIFMQYLLHERPARAKLKLPGPLAENKIGGGGGGGIN